MLLRLQVSCSRIKFITLHACFRNTAGNGAWSFHLWKMMIQWVFNILPKAIINFRINLSNFLECKLSAVVRYTRNFLEHLEWKFNFSHKFQARVVQRNSAHQSLFKHYKISTHAFSWDRIQSCSLLIDMRDENLIWSQTSASTFELRLKCWEGLETRVHCRDFPCVNSLICTASVFHGNLCAVTFTSFLSNLLLE